MYADDTQLYYHCNYSDIKSIILKINQDLEQIQKFSTNNCLKLNTDKSYFIIIGSRPNLSKLNKLVLPPITINNEVIERKNFVKNLGVIFDETFSWTNHVNKMISKAYFKLKQAYRFKKFLSQDSKIIICESYILSHFNYCDTVYYNISEFLKLKIQKVQNSCFRFVFGLKKYDHISSSLTKLGTLNMDERRHYHGLTLMHKINNNLAPSYLMERIKHNEDFHNYNTRNKKKIATEKHRTTLRQNSFFPCFSKLYNEIMKDRKFKDISIKTFQKHTKDYLIKNRNKQ